jgi:hypothetical protein
VRSGSSADLYLLLLGEVALAAGVSALVEAGRLFRARSRQLAPGDGAPASAAPGMSFLRVALGSLWVLDGALQAQPAMPRGFAAGILAPVALGQPGWLAGLLTREEALWRAHPVHLTVATVLIQVGIGVAILAGGSSRLGRLGLWASVGWGIVVWIGGEAMGGLLAPGASLLLGAPGGALAYVAAAGVLLAPPSVWERRRAGKWVEAGLGALFLLGALAQMLPAEGFWSGSGLGPTLTSLAATPQPTWISGPILGLAHLAQSQPFLVNTSLVVILGAMGTALLLGGAGRLTTTLGLVLLFLIWWLGQDFGTLGTGIATDPNLAPLLAVLLLAAHRNRALHLAGPRPLPAALRRVAVLGVAAIAVGAWVGVAYVPNFHPPAAPASLGPHG